MQTTQRHPFPMPSLTVSALALALALPAPDATAEMPYAMPDDAWISIDGTVESVRPDSFILSYANGMYE
jgi:hypothetical protein